jgi:hypothetical protein
MADVGLLDVARKQIEFAREYTWSLISDIADVDWYRTPAGSPTHVAWRWPSMDCASSASGDARKWTPH